MTRLFHRIKKLLAITRREGIRGVLSTLRNFVLTRENRRLEHRYGLDIQSTAHLDSLTVIGDHESEGFYYVPSAAPVVNLLLGHLTDEIDDFTFVDYGSGKGLVLLVAAHYPFREVIGVEFAEELHAAAEENIGKYGAPGQRCKNVVSVCADAAEYEVPSNNCVLYFCNPFTEPLMKRVLSNIEASHRKHGQKIFVLFNQLFHEDAESTANTGALLEAAEFLFRRPLKRRGAMQSLLMRHIDLRIYEAQPMQPR